MLIPKLTQFGVKAHQRRLGMWFVTVTHEQAEESRIRSLIFPIRRVITNDDLVYLSYTVMSWKLIKCCISSMHASFDMLSVYLLHLQSEISNHSFKALIQQQCFSSQNTEALYLLHKCFSLFFQHIFLSSYHQSVLLCLKQRKWGHVFRFMITWGKTDVFG